MVRDKSFGSIAFDIFNIAFLTLMSLVTVLPFINIIACSFASTEELLTKKFILFPTTFSFDSYQYIFSTNTIPTSLSNSVFITVVGTIVNLFMTALMAYPLAHPRLKGRKQIMIGIVFTMLFSAGMIPNFLVVKGVGLINSLWALIIPGAISSFNLIIIRNFFEQIPDELEESARIDGCSEWKILLRIILPLSIPVMATFGLFYAVNHWNTFLPAVLYLNDSKKWPIQVILRQVVIVAQGGVGNSSAFDDKYIPPPSQSVKMATIVVATLPILMVYPFLQKHFVKGVLLGSIKG